MADEPARRVLDAAIAVARNAPARRGTYVSHAKIYWPLIEELRAALDELDADDRIEAEDRGERDRGGVQ